MKFLVKRRWAVCAACVVSWGHLTASSQNRPVPPAGILERELEQEYETQKVRPNKEQPPLELDLPSEELDVGEGSVTVESVEISGNQVLSAQHLDISIAHYLHQSLSMEQLKQLCRTLEKAYAQEGYFLTRVYLPPQEIKDGVLKVSVIEGRLGRVIITGNRHYTTPWLMGYFEPLQGEVIEYDRILRALFLLEEYPDLKVGAVFVKGSSFGTADMMLRVSDERPVHLAFDTNNYGSDHTTHQRSSLKLDYTSLAMQGDTLTVIEVLGSPVSHLNFTDVIYRVPIMKRGTFIEASYLCANFKTDRVDGIRYVGRSHIGQLKVSQALQRGRKLSTDLYGTFDVKQIQNFGGGQRTSFDRLRVLTGGGSVDYIDPWNGRNLWNLSVGWGIPGLFGGLEAESHLSSRQGAGGRFVKLNGSWKRVNALPWDLLLWFQVSGQWGLDKMPLPEQIYIGGAETIRGYPLAEGIGDSGYYGTFELRVPPPLGRTCAVPWSKTTTWGEAVQFVAFVDGGQTFAIGNETLRQERRGRNGKKSKRTHRPGAVTLVSVGPGVRLLGPWKFEWSFDVGFPLTQRYRSSNTMTYFRVACKPF